jgi:hypothetical protein
MNGEESMDAMQNPTEKTDLQGDIRAHWRLLGHCDLGVTELRVFDPKPMVAYADGEDAVVGLCLDMEGQASGIYIGVQPRPAHLFDLAPNRWVPARGGPEGNCARDHDIEYITAVFFDIDVVSEERARGHPASQEELRQSLQAAQLLARQDGLALNSTICCSGNGHYVLAPVAPLSVGSEDVAWRFKGFCCRLVASVASQLTGVRIDPVYNLSRVMRVMGTVNRKGDAVPGRPHRRACFVTEPVLASSLALHHMIVNTEVGEVVRVEEYLPTGLRCDLRKIEGCEFIQWCRAYPQGVSEPQWFGLIANLVHLEGGMELIHEISRLDTLRYDYADTQRVIQRLLRVGYRPVSCAALMSPAMVRLGRGAFYCPRIHRCPAKAPMFLAISHTVYTR